VGRTVGIDLGTTNSVIAVVENGRPIVIANAEGSFTTPSVVEFPETGDVIVGEAAKRHSLINHERTITAVRRLMGRRWSETIDEVQYTAPDISAMILKKLRWDAEAYLGERVTHAVLTVPAFFDDDQREATREAGDIAGLEVMRLLNEPTAAALAYGLGGKVLVFDLGGRTLDVTLLEIRAGVATVRATAGDTVLGGENWDQVIVDNLLTTIRTRFGINLADDSNAMQRLQAAAERAKIELSSSPAAAISEQFLAMRNNEPMHMVKALDRQLIEHLGRPLLNQCWEPIKKALQDAGLGVSEIDHVVLSGGATQMPSVAGLVRDSTGKEPHDAVKPDEVVAVGAALQAGLLTGEIMFEAETSSQPEPLPFSVLEPEPQPAPEPKVLSWDFFVSYTQKDKAWAEWIAWQLDSAGYRVLIQAWHMVAGSNWTVMMQEGMSKSARTLAIVSNAYLKSVYGEAEWLGAYRADPQGFERKLIPIRVEECDRPGILGGIVSFDLFGLSKDVARTQLLKHITAALAGHDKPGAEPMFPVT
jgi:actin-like ATPase involved in cell morphogenesis